MSRLLACVLPACAVMLVAVAAMAQTAPDMPPVASEAPPAAVVEAPPAGQITLSRLPSGGPDILYLELNSLTTGTAPDGTITADVWTFLALGSARTFDGATFSGAWSRDHIDCAGNSVANGKVLHMLDASGKVVRTMTQVVEATPLAADSLYTYITGKICGGKAYGGTQSDSVVEAMARAGMKSRAAEAPSPPPQTVWYLGGQNADMNVAFATGQDAATEAPMLYAHFSLAQPRRIVGSYYDAAYGYLTALEYDCEAGKARADYATYFDASHVAADASLAVSEWKPFAAQGLAAPVLQSLCHGGILSSKDSVTGDARVAQAWLYGRLHRKK